MTNRSWALVSHCPSAAGGLTMVSISSLTSALLKLGLVIC